MFNPYKY
jgi:hypothetical protein